MLRLIGVTDVRLSDKFSAYDENADGVTLIEGDGKRSEEDYALGIQVSLFIDCCSSGADIPNGPVRPFEGTDSDAISAPHVHTVTYTLELPHAYERGLCTYFSEFQALARDTIAGEIYPQRTPELVIAHPTRYSRCRCITNELPRLKPKSLHTNFYQ